MICGCAAISRSISRTRPNWSPDAHADVRSDAVAERGRIDLRRVAADHAALLERAGATKALGCRQVNLGCQLDVAGSAGALQRRYDLAVNGVQ